ncbi:hypothetical protein ACRALDRAFT_2061345 [Sodiomyces alcalophilus JCM 7366]|uniref:uncharacterized protein n=1 Tax=Sodiomyces alcalophilus JCM 7366 TaxID=591952 RepID=UPI0039B503A1
MCKPFPAQRRSRLLAQFRPRIFGNAKSLCHGPRRPCSFSREKTNSSQCVRACYTTSSHACKTATPRAKGLDPEASPQCCIPNLVDTDNVVECGELAN